MEDAAFDDWSWFMSVPFKPNLLNTTVWLVETSQQISVLFVNYKGQPWMRGMLENQPLFLSLFGCVTLVAICAWGAIPYLNEILNLEVFPEDLRPIIMITLFISLIGSFIWDRLCQAIFAPEIFRVTVEQAKAVTIMDLVPVLKTVGYMIGGALFLLSGNPIIWGLGFMMYRSYKQQPPAQPQQPQQQAHERTTGRRVGS